jgi:hypothetical protein
VLLSDAILQAHAARLGGDLSWVFPVEVIPAEEDTGEDYLGY